MVRIVGDVKINSAQRKVEVYNLRKEVEDELYRSPEESKKSVEQILSREDKYVDLGTKKLGGGANLLFNETYIVGLKRGMDFYKIAQLGSLDGCFGVMDQWDEENPTRGVIRNILNEGLGEILFIYNDSRLVPQFKEGKLKEFNKYISQDLDEIYSKLTHFEQLGKIKDVKRETVKVEQYKINGYEIYFKDNDFKLDNALFSLELRNNTFEIILPLNITLDKFIDFGSNLKMLDTEVLEKNGKPTTHLNRQIFTYNRNKEIFEIYNKEYIITDKEVFEMNRPFKFLKEFSKDRYLKYNRKTKRDYLNVIKNTKPDRMDKVDGLDNVITTKLETFLRAIGQNELKSFFGQQRLLVKELKNNGIPIPERSPIVL